MSVCKLGTFIIQGPVDFTSPTNVSHCGRTQENAVALCNCAAFRRLPRCWSWGKYIFQTSTLSYFWFKLLANFTLLQQLPFREKFALFCTNHKNRRLFCQFDININKTTIKKSTYYRSMDKGPTIMMRDLKTFFDVISREYMNHFMYRISKRLRKRSWTLIYLLLEKCIFQYLCNFIW